MSDGRDFIDATIWAKPPSLPSESPARKVVLRLMDISRIRERLAEDPLTQDDSKYVTNQDIPLLFLMCVIQPDDPLGAAKTCANRPSPAEEALAGLLDTNEQPHEEQSSDAVKAINTYVTAFPRFWCAKPLGHIWNPFYADLYRRLPRFEQAVSDPSWHDGLTGSQTTVARLLLRLQADAIASSVQDIQKEDCKRRLFDAWKQRSAKGLDPFGLCCHEVAVKALVLSLAVGSAANEWIRETVLELRRYADKIDSKDLFARNIDGSSAGDIWTLVDAVTHLQKGGDWKFLLKGSEELRRRELEDMHVRLSAKRKSSQNLNECAQTVIRGLAHRCIAGDGLCEHYWNLASGIRQWYATEIAMLRLPEQRLVAQTDHRPMQDADQSIPPAVGVPTSPDAPAKKRKFRLIEVWPWSERQMAKVEVRKKLEAKGIRRRTAYALLKGCEDETDNKTVYKEKLKVRLWDKKWLI